ncbi:MAG: HipA N-terminal domain-containing protein [Acidimicrobiaceae bacterium]|nr:HipA N-terminal domain-containing protein [Acidimicrobiaceae bacterium]
MPAVETLSVLIGCQHAADASRSDDRSGLVYTEEYLVSRGAPLSIGMPKTGRRFPLLRLSAWMEGLLPDNPQVVEQQRRLFGVKGRSSFDLLATPMGMDCAGAVQFCFPHRVATVADRGGGVEWLDDRDLASLVSSLTLANSTWLGGRTFGQFSLVGAQAKTALQF